ncbi:MAG: papain-like cysteine peptidase [Muribaculaceae bacterium]|nr:papain-like cysteine peptidase [Muribaculaceae bacterium]
MSGNKKYDFVFGIGEACSCTQVLRACNLQLASYPFDWLFGSDFIGRCNILANGFDKFLEKDELEFSYEERNISCVAYRNKYNDITFNHDFNKDTPFDAMYNEVKNKYDRRIKRLLENINHANTVLIVYIEVPTNNHPRVLNDEIINGYNIIKSKYNNKNIDLIYIKNHSTKYETEKLTNNITIITKDYKNKDTNIDYEVDKKKLMPIFKQHKLTNSFKIIFKKKMLKLFINLLPHKITRQKLRKKYHV